MSKTRYFIETEMSEALIIGMGNKDKRFRRIKKRRKSENYSLLIVRKAKLKIFLSDTIISWTSFKTPSKNFSFRDKSFKEF